MANQKEESPVQKIKIKLKSYDNKIIDSSTRQIIEVLSRYGVKMVGPIPLPVERHLYTVNRDVFVHKDSREQFEIRIHKRLIEVYDLNPRVIDALQNLNLPAGVEIEIKI